MSVARKRTPGTKDESPINQQEEETKHGGEPDDFDKQIFEVIDIDGESENA